MNDYLSKIRRLCKEIDEVQIKRVMALLEANKEKTIFVAGNGGSAATASHMACDLGRHYKIICLHDNLPSLMANANDYGYRFSLAMRLVRLAKPGDILLVLSGKGNSENIIEAVRLAVSLHMRTIAFLGFDGGLVKDLVDEYIIVPSFEYGPVEDFHLILNHLIVETYENRN